MVSRGVRLSVGGSVASVGDGRCEFGSKRSSVASQRSGVAGVSRWSSVGQRGSKFSISWGSISQWGSEFCVCWGSIAGVRHWASDLGYNWSSYDWSNGFHGKSSRLFVDNCVESVDGVGGVMDDSASSVRFLEGVAALDDVSIAGFFVVFVVSGQSILDSVSIGVLRLVMVVGYNCFCQRCSIGKGRGNWYQTSTGCGQTSGEDYELKKLNCNTK